MNQMIVGRSVNGKPLKAYQWISPGSDLNRHPTKDSSSPAPLSSEIKPLHQSLENTVLFLSLVHGNEPLGLLTHLHTARRILEELPPWIKKQQPKRKNYSSIQVIFFPIVNPDAYQLNRQHGSGCRRTNLNPVSCSKTSHHVGESSPASPKEPEVSTCPNIPNAGVDLNRNFPVDWNGTFSPSDNWACGRLLKGPHPFSEPETRAIRRLVLGYNHTITAAMSFHSRSGMSKDDALLIHPFASLRPITMMDVDDARRFRQWSKLMNTGSGYVTGTALESIGYAAGGATIDWLYAQFKIMAFVHESTTPCGQRWCSSSYQHSITSQAHTFAQAGLRLVQLALDVPRVKQKSGLTNLEIFSSSAPFSSTNMARQTLSILLYAFSALAIFMAWSFRRSRLARFHGATGRLASSSSSSSASPKRTILQEHEIDL